MPGIDDRLEQVATPRTSAGPAPKPTIARSDIPGLVDAIAGNGDLVALLAYACEKAMMDEPDGPACHPGVQAATRAFEAWKQTEGPAMATETRDRPASDDPKAQEPETLPLSLLGQWVALVLGWDADRRRGGDERRGRAPGRGIRRAPSQSSNATRAAFPTMKFPFRRIDLEPTSAHPSGVIYRPKIPIWIGPLDGPRRPYWGAPRHRGR